ncbi:(2,3-dihydroxybenzoyl)adenylate synthase [Pantoea sp. Bo_2]|uniref:(2,3-dihydroxybenzoyl)adenylate synthase n=1 Tax=unclassified Pantoea TaxID=2630326 RepID=UPI001232BDCA|nr:MULTISPECIES: (2,3-dihydroxybenzoyl)adenylate synthase [unclassified Pantoea]KAA5947880.1 (2,3-dihydroxybenzoyl)adenylate synthase [Pantoea sp. VH_3]KAA5952720.1 (2,3-dihydroxybenzoyl)adenylate synthase [Pantoea sp. VH_25]KAA5958252.1 (2,3-dihydroxybenzoyl)adenylate synthase [Pantoea sp. VH_24]KAA5962330.1 (2,3-dihydroxybenzoyl)adenylate synthase [Pantoea sp. VH_16]KAA5966056.1 (2,3-dihydroxybenzoyl)adenylate synthase [Pantoea sp. VH_18]
MTISYSRWPDDLAARYREKGFWLDLPMTDILDRHRDSECLAVIDGDRQFTYRQLASLSDNLAAALQRRGLKPGDTALVQLGNVAEFYLTLFALFKIGVAPVNALLSHQRTELAAYASQIAPRLLIADRSHPLFTDDAFITQLRREQPSLQQVILRNDAHAENSLNALLAEPADDFRATPTAGDEVAFFQLSGGSTGTPKLIPRTHNDYYYSIRESDVICGVNADTRYLIALPAAHNFPMSSPGALGVFYAGGQVILAADPSATLCFPLIEKHQVTDTGLVPPAASLWLQAIQEGGSNAALASLQRIQVGGAKLGETLAARIQNEIGCTLQQVFGMAEGLVNYTRLDDDEQTILTTQGRPISPDDEVWVADEQGHPLPVGAIGRLMTRGPYTFRGYYNSPEHNATSFDDQGFYCSGDLVEITPAGNIIVQGREKDQINRGGEKIAAEEIENLLQRHADVIHAALVSMSDELMGEKSCAFIVTRQPVKPVALRRHLRELGVAEFKLPDRITCVDALPLTAVGKVDKKRLRQQLADQRAQA